MTYDDKYDAMPLRGKTTFYGWLRHHNRKGWWDDSRRYRRKYHRHYDPHKDWWKDDTIGVAYRHLPKWWVNEPSKGYKRKTWRDFR